MSAVEEKEVTSSLLTDDHSHDVNNVKESEDSQTSLSENEKQLLLEKIRSRKGSASIKEEYIDLKRFNQLFGVSIREEGKSQNEDTAGEPPRKKQKVKGQNKIRPRTKWVHPSEKLCVNVALGRDCVFGDKCKYSHNVADCMAKKLPDLGPKCYNFDTFGYCEFGLNCRFGSSHISQDFRNITDDSRKVNMKDLTSNNLSFDMKQDLRKRRIKFTGSETFLKSLSPKGNKKSYTAGHIISKSGHEKVATVPSEDVKTELSSAGKSEPPISCQDASNVKKSVDIPSHEDSENSNGPCSKPLQVPCSSSGDNSTTSYSRLTEATDVSSSENASSDKASERICDSSMEPEKQHQTSKKEVRTSTNVSTSDETSRNYLVQLGILKERKRGWYGAQGGCATHTPHREKKQLDVEGKLWLAPLTTVGNLPFRRICKRFGADITCGEMAMCTKLLQGEGFEWALLRRHHTEDVFGVQLCGAFPDTMTKCAEMVSSHLNVDFIDVNVGCPIDLVYKKGAGSGLMNRMSKFEQIVRGMSSVMDIPLTVKMRMGVQENKNIAHTLIPKLYDWGASVTIVHGRSREARYTRSADWEYLTTCADAAAPYPFVGNGDILSFEDANEHFNKSGSAGLMIARGALIKPWIFTEIKEQRHWDISASERLDILRDFTNYGLENWGSDTQGVDKTRRFLLEWLSFLHRYIPVGIMERLPQRINERPPYYFGRNDLETLMSSANCADWVKVSEMLLGPVPDDFSFLPKHKANSYK